MFCCTNTLFACVPPPTQVDDKYYPATSSPVLHIIGNCNFRGEIRVASLFACAMFRILHSLRNFYWNLLPNNSLCRRRRPLQCTHCVYVYFSCVHTFIRWRTTSDATSSITLNELLSILSVFEVRLRVARCAHRMPLKGAVGGALSPPNIVNIKYIIRYMGFEPRHECHVSSVCFVYRDFV